MKLLLTLIKKELLEQLRTNKVIILIFTFLFVAIGSPILAKIIPKLFENISMPGLTINIPTPTYRDAIDQFVKNISQLPTFIIVFAVAGAISDEKAKKTLEILLTKPIKRSLFILAKFKSYFFTIGLLYIACALIFYTYTVSIFSSFAFGNFALLSFLILLYFLFIVSITMFGSVISKSTISSALIGFVGLIIFGTIVGSIGKISKYSTSYVLSNYKNIVESGWNKDFLPSVIVTLILIVLSFILSIYFFQRQEIER